MYIFMNAYIHIISLSYMYIYIYLNHLLISATALCICANYVRQHAVTISNIPKNHGNCSKSPGRSGWLSPSHQSPGQDACIGNKLL